MPFFITLNIIALFFGTLLILSLSRSYRILFITSITITIILLSLLAFAGYNSHQWGFKEFLMMLLRGGFTISIVCGALSCFIATKMNYRGENE